MNKLCIIILIGIFAIGFTSTKANYPNLTDVYIADKKPKNPKFKIKVHFGKKVKGCKGFSLTFCEIILHSAPWPTPIVKNDFGSANGAIFIDTDNKLVIEFDKASMTDETINTFFNQTFYTEEAFEVSREILDKLNYSGVYNIPPGSYNYQETETILKVKF